jgi:hypothetical protein
MARVGRDITAQPDPGEKILYSGDLGQFLDELRAAGDDGDTVLIVRTTLTGKIKSIRGRPQALPEAPLLAPPPQQADEPDSWRGVPALGPGGGGAGQPAPVPVRPGGAYDMTARVAGATPDMMAAPEPSTDLDLPPVTGTTLARQEPVGPRHRK